MRSVQAFGSTSSVRGRRLEEHMLSKAYVDSIYPWWWDEREFPRRAVMTEWFYNPLKGQPRYIDVYHLKNMAVSEWVKSCTSTIIEEVCQVDWNIVPKRPELRESPPEQLLWQIEDITEFFKKCNPNKETINKVLRAFLNDSLVLDAACLVKGFSERSYESVPAGGFILRERGRRELVEIFARDGGSFMKETDINGIERRVWQYSYLHPAVAPIEFDVDEIAYGIRYPQSGSCYGWGELQSMETVLNCLINSAFTNATMFQEYAVPSGVISFSGSLDDERRLKEYFTTEIKGRFHKVAVLNKDAKFVPMTLTNRDMDFINMQKWFSRIVWMLYKLTPSEMGFQDEIRETGKAMSAQSKLQKRKAVLPILSFIEETLNTQIINEFSNDVMFQFDYTDKEEEYAMDELSLQQLDRGLITINELRKRRKMGSSVSWGDQPFQLTLASARGPAMGPMGAPQPQASSLPSTDMQEHEMGQQNVWGGRSTEEYDFRSDIPQPVRAFNPSSGRYEPVEVGNKFNPRSLKAMVGEIEKSFRERLAQPHKKTFDPYEVHSIERQLTKLKTAINRIPYPMGAMGTRPDTPSRDGMLLPGEQKRRDEEKPLGPNQTPAPYRTGPYAQYRGGQQPSHEFAGGHGAHKWERDTTNMRVKPGARADPRGLAPARKPTVPYLDAEYQIIPTPKIPVGPKYPRDVPPVHGATGMPRKPLTDEEEGDQVDEMTSDGKRKKMTPPLPSAGGGKYRQVKFLRSIMPEKLGLYVEPFAGGAALFFGLPEKPAQAVLNDKDPAFPSVWKWIQQATPEQVAALKAKPWLAERDDFFKVKDEFKPRNVLDRIWQILFTTRHSFRNSRRTWRGEDRKGTHRNAMPTWINRIDQYRERLQGVTIENKDWKEVMAEHDGPDTFFYIDPPYEQEFARELPAVLDKVKGNWLLSFGEDEELKRELERRGFHTHSLNVTNMINKPDAATRTTRQEMLAANYPIQVEDGTTFKYVNSRNSLKIIYFKEYPPTLKTVHSHESDISSALKAIMLRVYQKQIGKDQAIIEAKAAIDHHIVVPLRKTTLELASRKLQKDVLDLPPEAEAAIERQAQAHFEDFKRILGDAENAETHESTKEKG